MLQLLDDDDLLRRVYLVDLSIDELATLYIEAEVLEDRPHIIVENDDNTARDAYNRIAGSDAMNRGKTAFNLVILVDFFGLLFKRRVDYNRYVFD